jgi:polar amino acid transport system substrate-binding protein
MTYISLVKRFGIILCLITAACSAASHAEDSVRVAQDRLRTLGYDPGASDGVYGDKSRQAVHRFQADRKLKQSGELDRETAELLLADLVLYTQNFDPFHYANPVTGELDGPAVQLIKKTCADARLRCVLRLGDKSWEETQKQVRDGSGDGLFLIGWDASRAEYLQRTEEILSTEYGFFVRADDPLNFTGPKALDGYTVGVYGPSNTSKTLDKITVGLRSEGIRLDKDLQKDSDPVFRALSTSKGKYAVFSNKDVGNSIIRRLGLENIRYAGQQQCVSYYVGITNRLNNTDFLDRFNTAFSQIALSGLKRTILAPYGVSADAGACGKPTPVPATPLPTPPNPVTPPAQDCVVKASGDDAVVVCGKSCLTWQKSGSERPLTWHDASGSYLADLNARRFGSASDWRLPTSEEIRTLIRQDLSPKNRMFLIDGFDATQTDCWTADRRTDGGQNAADYVDFFEGKIGSKSATDTNYVRAVRGTFCGHR